MGPTYNRGPNGRPSASVTPITEAIGARRATGIDRAGRPLAGGAPSVPAGGDDSGTPSIFLKGHNALPVFEESELDDPQLLSSAAAELYRMRRATDAVLPDSLMGEPVWDMLLLLYLERPARLSMAAIGRCSGVPLSTALRWMRLLENGGLVQQREDACDGRITLVCLTQQGDLIVERSLKAMLRASGC